MRQTIADCLTRRWTSTGSSGCSRGIEAGDIAVVARDLTEPSPLALEVLLGAALRLPRRRAARGAPHPGGDEPALARRREAASDLGQLDAEAIARVRSEAWPEATNADELHDALVWLGFLTAEEVAAEPRLERLARRAWSRSDA